MPVSTTTGNGRSSLGAGALSIGPNGSERLEFEPEEFEAVTAHAQVGAGIRGA